MRSNTACPKVLGGPTAAPWPWQERDTMLKMRRQFRVWPSPESVGPAISGVTIPRRCPEDSQTRVRPEHLTCSWDQGSDLGKGLAKDLRKIYGNKSLAWQLVGDCKGD